MNKNIIVSGNENYGLSRALKKKFPQAHFASKSNGFDFANHDSIQRFAQISMDYNVYISCSSLFNFLQTRIVHEVYKKWEEAKHSGHIIAFGSSADTPVKGSTWTYPIEKKALRALCRNLSQRILPKEHPASNIRITYISPGNLNTPETENKYPNINMIDTDYLAELTAWVLSQPNKYNLSELCLDPVQ